MIKDFNLTTNEKDIGFYVGFIASSFSLAQFCTSLLWGYLSDKYGRKLIILIGLMGNSITMCLFGVSHSLAWALISRATCGLLNGNIGVAKCCMGEITDESYIARLLPLCLIFFF